jgi:F-type H+-transporting ATPase subunit a
MADPLLHIKDCYFFEVPRALWKRDWESMDEVPASVREWVEREHPHATVEEVNEALSGKILIPQPFGEIKNLFEPKSGFCISKFMILEVVAALLVFWLFYSFAKRIRGDKPTTSRGWNLVESLVVFVKEGIVEKAIPHGSEKYFPLLATFFFFIFTMNLIGMIPWLGAATGAFSLTLTLGATVFVAGLIYGSMSLGPIGYWKNYVPKIELPWFLYPMQIVLVIGITGLEIFGALIKHAVLGLRLMINMAAGHLVLLSILGIITAAAVTAETYSQWLLPATFSTLGSTLLSVMELGVAFLQAFVFTLLAALFINSATHSHHGDDHGHEDLHSDHGGHEPAVAHGH